MGDTKSADCSDKVEIVEKKPFRVLKFAVNQVVDIAIPLHLRTLETQCTNIEKYKREEDWVLVHNEQINASNTVRLLKSDIHELECLNCNVREEDQDLFYKKIQSPTREVVNALATFLASNIDLMVPLPQFDEDLSLEAENIPQLVCNLEQINDIEATENEQADLKQVQILERKPSKILKQWNKLKKEIIEIHELFKSFANTVFSQKESIDVIENHVQQAEENVIEGTKFLKKAVVLKYAVLPFAGAAIGGLLGPVGAAIGFNVAGSIACALGGSAVGYGIGRKIKRTHIVSSNLALEDLHDSSKRLSHSTPDLHTNSNEETYAVEETKKDR